MDERPNLNAKISVKDFKEFYWLKEELIEFCRKEKLEKTGSKIKIAERIEYYLKTGKNKITDKKGIEKKSKFDWKNKELHLETLITDNYKSTENVRKFFKKEVGKYFKFNVEFMDWIKSNTGKTLSDAVEEWHKIRERKKNDKAEKNISPQFEYNKYLRDFIKDNPEKGREFGIELWKIKKRRRGDNIYKKSDLKLIVKRK